MNFRGEVTAPWGDGEHTFKLSVAGILELEEKTAQPFAVVFARINGQAFGLADIYETLRLGLIGGGKTPVEAKKLVDRYVFPLAESAPVALLVLSAIMFGFEASPPGKAEAAPKEAESTPASMPPPSTETPASLASAPMSLEEFHSSKWWP